MSASSVAAAAQQMAHSSLASPHHADDDAAAALCASPGPEGGLAAESDDDDFQYEEVEVPSAEEDDDISEDLDAAMRSLQALTTSKGSRGGTAGGQQPHGASKPQTPPGQVVRRPEVVDDFMRNFFARAGLSRTAEVFEAEWYELKALGQLQAAAGSAGDSGGGNAGSMVVPDVYLRNEELEAELAGLRQELAAARELAARASGTWDRFRKERDFHRMHHKRVAQEKNRLITDVKRLKAHYAKYEPTILELKRKYEAAMKEKMLSGLERDKLAAKAHALEERLRGQQHRHGEAPHGQQPPSSPSPQPLTQHHHQQHQQHPQAPGSSGGGGAAPGGSSRQVSAATSVGARGGSGPGASLSPWPAAAAHPCADVEGLLPAQVNAYTCQHSFKAHLLPVANLALHPTKPILATASDDKTWKLWHLPAAELIMCGEGHRDWVAGVDFHPNGNSLASGSGDSTVKLWSFEKSKCVATLSDHKQAVWSVKHHHGGDWLASCSLDHSVRLWDLNLTKCRQVLRGHVDSVNDSCWQPQGAAIATASSDKTVSIWDPRSGLSTCTFYGHTNSCNSVVFSASASSLASADADGVVKLWDVRMVAEVFSVAAGEYPANRAAFDASGLVLAVASDDGAVRCFNTAGGGERICEMPAGGTGGGAGHEDAVQAVLFDGRPSEAAPSEFMVTCGSDCAVKIWA